MKRALVHTFLILILQSSLVMAQTQVGVFGTLGPGAWHGIGVKEFYIDRSGFGGGIQIRHYLNPSLFLASDPALRMIHIGSNLTFTTESGATVRDEMHVAVYNLMSLPVYAGFHLVKEGNFRPWLGLGIAYENAPVHEVVITKAGFIFNHNERHRMPRFERRQYLSLVNYLGFDWTLGKTKLVMQAGISPFYRMIYKSYKDSSIGQTKTNFGLANNHVRLNLYLPIKGDQFFITPGLEAYSRPLYLQNSKNYDKVFYGMLAINCGLIYKMK